MSKLCKSFFVYGKIKLTYLSYNIYGCNANYRMLLTYFKGLVFLSALTHAEEMITTTLQ